MIKITSIQMFTRRDLGLSTVGSNWFLSKCLISSLDTDRFYYFREPELSQSDTGSLMGCCLLLDKPDCRKPPKEDLLYPPRKERARLPEVDYKLLQYVPREMMKQLDHNATVQYCKTSISNKNDHR